ncbi:MAG TPA: DUF4097 family beta strand repeat-containing protein [Thermoanaerobaculia bacterium]|nr:DUF4097 family beta strand repeat-containing protein [Thermoanaerobaculia bacterium]
MRNHAWKAVALVALGLAAHAAAASAATLKEHFEQTCPLPAGGALSLSNVNGGVTVTAWDRNEVRVTAEKRVKAGTEDRARKLMAALKVEVAQNPGEVRIVTRYPHHDDGFWSWLSGDSGSTGVEYRLEVPRSVKLSLETVNGGIEVRGTAGDAHLETTNGQIVIAGIRGKINLETTNGSIKASGVAGSVAADTTNGGIDVHLTEVTRGAVMKFSTTNGGITVRLPKDIQTSVHASTTNGGVETDLPITVRGKVNRRRLDGDINGGGGRLDLETTNGVIHLLESGGR